MSPVEARVWNLLRMAPLSELHFRRQVPIGPYYADFASHGAKLIIEIDGSQHGTDAAMAYDARRDTYLMSQGYRVIRLTTLDVLDNLAGISELLMAELPLP